MGSSTVSDHDRATPAGTQTELDRELEELVETFVGQSEEGLNTMEQSLLQLEETPDDQESIEEIFRIVHTLKGDAGMVGFGALGGLAHDLEDLLTLVRDGEVRLNPGLVTLLLEVVDALRRLLDEGRRQPFGDEGAAEGRSTLADLVARIHARCVTDAYLRTMVDHEGAEQTSVAGPSAPTFATRSLRIDVSKLDPLLTLTGEITVARSRLTQLLEDPDSSRAEILEAHRESDLLHMDLQEMLMKLRLVPVGPVLRSFSRLVRDLGARLGKNVSLVVESGDVEVDNSVLQRLRDPLSHMIRNAVDHGIELPEKRRANGKSASGTVRLRAWHEASSVAIELSDDGAGVDLGKIEERAVASGRLSAGSGSTERELLDLMFEAGFSTAEEVTGLSGRGVGMDVVRRNIQALRGEIDLQSTRGQGTTITIRLPLTLAIIEGLMVRAGQETYAIPLDTVIECHDFEGDLDNGSAGVINLRGRPLPAVRLREFFGTKVNGSSRENLVVVRAGGSHVGLVLDEVFGKRQIVIKPLSKLFRRLEGFSGFTILGDGRVALILDPTSLLREHLLDTRTENISGDLVS